MECETVGMEPTSEKLMLLLVMLVVAGLGHGIVIEQLVI